MSWTDDPVADFLRYDEEKEQALERRPKCANCDEHIQDDELYDFGDGVLICPECLTEWLDANYKHSTDCYIDD